MRMGLYDGSPTRVQPHPVSGRADYFGPVCNRCAMSTCPGACQQLPHLACSMTFGSMLSLSTVQLSHPDKLPTAVM